MKSLMHIVVLQTQFSQKDVQFQRVCLLDHIHISDLNLSEKKDGRAVMRHFDSSHDEFNCTDSAREEGKQNVKYELA